MKYNPRVRSYYLGDASGMLKYSFRWRIPRQERIEGRPWYYKRTKREKFVSHDSASQFADLLELDMMRKYGQVEIADPVRGRRNADISE